MCFIGRYLYGKNFDYPEIKKHQTALARSGEFGRLWEELLASDEELIVSAEYRLYQCPRCHQIHDEYCLDLYKTVQDWDIYTPSDEEVLHRYKHLCPECKKKMELIPLLLDQSGRGDEKEEPVICPKCGDIAIARFSGFTD